MPSPTLRPNFAWIVFAASGERFTGGIDAHFDIVPVQRLAHLCHLTCIRLQLGGGRSAWTDQDPLMRHHHISQRQINSIRIEFRPLECGLSIIRLDFEIAVFESCPVPLHMISSSSTAAAPCLSGCRISLQRSIRARFVSRAGSRSEYLVPCPGSLSTRMSPALCVTVHRFVARPSQFLYRLRREEGLEIPDIVPSSVHRRSAAHCRQNIFSHAWPDFAARMPRTIVAQFRGCDYRCRGMASR